MHRIKQTTNLATTAQELYMTLAHFKNEGKNNNDIQMSTKSNIPENVGMNSVLNHRYYNTYGCF